MSRSPRKSSSKRRSPRKSSNKRQSPRKSPARAKSPKRTHTRRRSPAPSESPLAVLEPQTATLAHEGAVLEASVAPVLQPRPSLMDWLFGY